MKTWLKESGKEIILNEETDTEVAARELGWVPKDEVVDNAEELAAKAAAEKAKADQEAFDAAAKKAQEDADAKKVKPVEEMTLEELHAVALTFDKKMPANILLETARKKVSEMLEEK